MMREKLTNEPEVERKPLSIRWKWAITLSLVFFSLYMIISSVLFLIVRNYSLKSEVTAAEQTITQTTVLFQQSGHLVDASTLATFLQQTSDEATSHPLIVYANDIRGVTLRVYDADLNVLYADREFLEAPIKAEEVVLVEETEVNQQIMLLGTSPIFDSVGHVTGYLQMQFRLDAYHQWIAAATQMFLVLALLSVVICVVVGNLLAYYFYLPIKYMTTIMNEVEEDNLSRIRIEPRGSSDELTDLSRGINDLLDRMELYISQQKQFVEDVSHELRTPVAIVEGHLNLLHRWGKTDPTVLDEGLAASLNEIGRMKQLVQEMLHLSRAEQATIHYKKELTDINDVVAHAFNNFQVVYPEFTFFLNNDIKWSEIWVRMYRNHFEQVLIILLDNAVKYSQERKDIEIGVSKNFTNVQIEVRDFGEGITEENIKKIFSRFYRVDKARSRERGGNGLGLAIAKELIEGYKGDITVVSTVGRGSCFRISLPIVTDREVINRFKRGETEEEE